MLPNQKTKFNDFYKSARYNAVLSDKTSLLVHLGASMAVGCYPCMKFYMDQVDTVGVSDDEISAVESIVMAVSAGRIREQFNEVLTGKGTCEEDNNCED
jgi:alkylhydroperoxidase/carboxymuconolactone decarboxylase family protein YurZ